MSERMALALVALAACGGSPRVDSIAPASGSARGGDEVTLAGRGLGKAAAVDFGGMAAAIVANDAAGLVVRTPRHVAGVVEVRVDGVSAGTYRYDPLAIDFIDASDRLLGPWAAFASGAARSGDVGLAVAAGRDGLRLVDLRLAGAASTSAWNVDARYVAARAPSDLLASAAVPGDGALLRADGARIGLPAFAASASADFDRDGLADAVLLVVDPLGDKQKLAFAGGAALAAAVDKQPLLPQALVLDPIAAGGLVAADFDRDGLADLFVAGAADRSRLYLGDGAGSFKLAPVGSLPALDAPGAGQPGAGDLDGDGDVDLVVPAATGDRVYLNDGKGKFYDASDKTLGPGSKSDAAVLGDVDLDGHLDVVLVSRNAPTRLLRNDGSGRLFDYSDKLRPNRAGAAAAVLVDADGDGDDDLFLARPDGSLQSLLVDWGPEPLIDGDHDGIVDALDNCPAAPNPDQANRDRQHFQCASAASCAKDTGCDLSLGESWALLVCGKASANFADAKAACAKLGATLAKAADVGKDTTIDGLWIAGDADCTLRHGDGTAAMAGCDEKHAFACRDERARGPDPGDVCDRCPSEWKKDDTPVDPRDDKMCQGMMP